MKEVIRMLIPLSLAQIIPQFNAPHEDIKTFAFYLAVMIFIVALAKVIFRPKGD
jgi:hypothetical protein